MENENSIKQIISNALQEVRAVIDADTIVGQPIPLQSVADDLLDRVFVFHGL